MGDIWGTRHLISFSFWTVHEYKATWRKIAATNLYRFPNAQICGCAYFAPDSGPEAYPARNLVLPANAMQTRTRRKLDIQRTKLTNALTEMHL